MGPFEKRVEESEEQTARDYVRSVARRFKGKGSYMIGSMKDELKKYERPNDETYLDFATRYLSDEQIEREWHEALK